MKKTALVTGVTSGIGLATARKLHAAGFRIIGTGRNLEALNKLSAELGDAFLPLNYDVTDCKATEEAVRSIPAEWSEIDVLVNNAGLALGLEPEFEGSLDDWFTMIDTNIKGLLHMTRLIVPGMIERGRGHIINVGSVAGDAAYANGAVYCATKSAVKTITDGLRIDLVNTPLRVTLVKPGLVETNFSKVRFHGDEERADNVYKGITPLTGDDIADTIVYAVQAPAHVQIAELLVLATYQGSGSVIARQPV
ncbi:MAG: SDR family NAD(P)-dependent oxidoreductase [Bacteroides sp.]|nr:SDR family NAD(P)-dependent oxidoreductase [Bacteroides sp.]MBD5337100.1 SDR family NAD(P)-dependent oxidoreductase [Bacteroides sp.]